MNIKKQIVVFCVSFIALLNSNLLLAQPSTVTSSDSLIQRVRLSYQENPNLAYQYATQAVVQAKKENSDLNLGIAYEMLGLSLDYLSKLDSALYYYDKAAPLLSAQSDKIHLGQLYITKANTLYLLNRNQEAILYYQKAYDLLKISGNIKKQAGALMGMANIYSIMKSYELSLKYYAQSLDLVKQINDEQFTSYILTNISEVYTSMRDYKKAIEYESQSLKIKEKIHKDYDLVYTYINLAELLMMENLNYKDSALMYLNKAVALSNKIDNQEFLCSSYQGMVKFYDAINDNQKAIEYAYLALELSKRIKNIRSELNISGLLSNIFEEQKNFEKANEYIHRYIILNDSINNMEVRKSFNELQTKYETDKKEKEIMLLNERDKKRTYFIYSSIIVVALLGLLSFTLYNRFRLKKKVAGELEKRNKEIEIQKNLVDEKQTEILDSINYAKRIQYALLAQEEVLKRNLKNYFILFKPKDIVSGDFYWATEHQDKFYLAVCDSTGHGVPGAFMSLLNIGFLSEAVKEKQITKPHEILNYVRQRLIESIATEGQQDGMDAILICLDKKNSKITYAAANNQPVLIQQSSQLVELSKDKLPVGKSPHEQSFNLYEIDAQKGDKLYLYTDGFADQFGGPKKKKFKYKQLHDLLLNNSNLPLAKQYQNLESSFNSWRGDLEQIDDVLILGFEI
ncbi:MAG: SpoIIE family protein phosphatase [Bacteroidia bacterium]|nr:SpoIIE family protein phosphatase [Bacteroidia bacterium]